MRLFQLMLITFLMLPLFGQAQDLSAEDRQAVDRTAVLIRFDSSSETLTVKKMITSDSINLVRVSPLDSTTQIRESFILTKQSGTYLVAQYILRYEELDTYFYEELVFRLNSGFRSGYTVKNSGYAKDGNTLWKMKSGKIKMWGKSYPPLDQFDYEAHRSHALSNQSLRRIQIN